MGCEFAGAGGRQQQGEGAEAVREPGRVFPGHQRPPICAVCVVGASGIPGMGRIGILAVPCACRCVSISFTAWREQQRKRQHCLTPHRTLR